MKTYKKSKLVYKNGYIMTAKGKIVSVDNRIVMLANQLELDHQKAEYESNIECACEACACEEFEPKSEFKRPVIEAKTPVLDKKVEESIALMDDLDRVQAANKVNSYLDKIDDLIQFAREDFVVDTKQDKQYRFDLPTLGNPLEWTGDKVVEFAVDLV